MLLGSLGLTVRCMGSTVFISQGEVSYKVRECLG